MKNRTKKLIVWGVLFVLFAVTTMTLDARRRATGFFFPVPGLGLSDVSPS